MTAAVVQHAARERLGRLRARRQPANDLLDSVLEIHTPADIRAELDQLRASYDVVNAQAKGRPDWDAHYAEFVHFYEDTRPRTFGVAGYLKVSTGTLNNVRQRARRLEEWKAQLQAAGVKVPEPPKKEPESDWGWLKVAGAAAAAAFALGALSK